MQRALRFYGPLRITILDDVWSLRPGSQMCQNFECAAHSPRHKQSSTTHFARGGPRYPYLFADMGRLLLPTTTSGIALAGYVGVGSALAQGRQWSPEKLW
jgi:hypothetical protein